MANIPLFIYMPSYSNVVGIPSQPHPISQSDLPQSDISIMGKDVMKHGHRHDEGDIIVNTQLRSNITGANYTTSIVHNLDVDKFIKDTYFPLPPILISGMSCPICNSDKTQIVRRQTRALDEPESFFIRCFNCGGTTQLSN